MLNRSFAITLLAVFILGAANLWASSSLSYSGRLVNANGSPVPGPVDLKFDLAYTIPGGVGSVLCTQQLTNVSLSNGVFHVKLDPDCSPSTLTTVLAQVPVGESVAIRVTDETSSKTYSYQALYSIPYSHVSKQLAQMGANANDILQWDGSQWTPVSIGAVTGVGTVTEINTGVGLTGGPISTSGTISIADGGVSDSKLASGISRSKLANGTPNYVLMNSGSGVVSEVAQLPVAQGGTGAANANDARANLGLGTSAVFDYLACLPGQVSKFVIPGGWSCVADNDSLDSTKLPLDGSVAMTGELILNADPVAALGATTKQYVDGKVSAINSSQWSSVGSDIYYDGGNVGIGTNTPTAPLSLSTAGVIRIGRPDQNNIEGTELGSKGLFFRNSSNFSARLELSPNGRYALSPTDGAGTLRGFDANTYWMGTLYSTSNYKVAELGSGSLIVGNHGYSSTALIVKGSSNASNPDVVKFQKSDGVDAVRVDYNGNILLSGKASFKSDNGNYVELRAPLALASTLNFILPGSLGSAGQALTTDGSGNLSWASVATTASTVGGDLNGTIASAQINANAVGTLEIADLSVSDVDIANNTITYGKLNLADGSIPEAKVNGLTTALSGKEPTITAGTSSQYWRGDKSWQTLNTSAIPEGTNLYFLDSRVRSALLTGYTAGSALSLAPTDNLLQALGKLEGQIIANKVAFDGTGQWSKSGAAVYYNGGNVGIGTSAPSEKFEIHLPNTVANDNINLYAKVTNLETTSVKSGFLAQANAGLGYLRIHNNSADPRIEIVAEDNSTYQPDITFFTNASERMRIDNITGNIGIGLTNPSRKLDVSGEVAARNGYGDILYLGGDGVGNDFEIGSHTAGKNTLSFYNRADASRMNINANNASFAGTLAAGLTTTSYQFQVQKDFTGLSNVTAAFIGGTDVDTAKTGVYFVEKDNTSLGSNATRLLHIVQHDDPMFTVTGTGNVGVGIIDPTERLQVAGNIKVGIANPVNSGTFPAYGSVIHFSGGPAGATFNSDNSDPIYMGRYNSASDASELRVSIGDNPSNVDKFNVGYTLSGVWNPRFTAQLDGIGIFNNGTQTCTINPASGVACSSDLRLKENINPIESALDKVLAIEGVTFTWKNDESKVKKRDLGFIAQNVETSVPELVVENEQGYKQVNYANFVAVLTEGLKEFYQKWLTDSEDKGRELASIKEENQELNARLEQLENENRELKKAVCEINPNAEICKK